MSRSPESPEISCDAPAHSVVQACEGLGFDSPLDVRWLRLSHFVTACAAQPNGGGSDFWGWLFKRDRLEPGACTCRAPLPELENYTFTFASGRVIDYQLGQCRCCRTIFWEGGVNREMID